MTSPADDVMTSSPNRKRLRQDSVGDDDVDSDATSPLSPDIAATPCDELPFQTVAPPSLTVTVTSSADDIDATSRDKNVPASHVNLTTSSTLPESGKDTTATSGCYSSRVTAQPPVDETESRHPR